MPVWKVLALFVDLCILIALVPIVISLAKDTRDMRKKRHTPKV